MNNPYYDSTLQNDPKTNWGSVAGGVIGLGLNAYRTANQGLYLNQQIAPSQYDLNSAPSYTAGAANSEAVNSKIQNATAGEVLGGAGTGAAIGTQILPGIGTAAGAVIGGIVSAVGGDARGTRQQHERQAALRRVIGAQQSYNTQNINFRNLQNQREDYLRRINPYNRDYAVNQTRF